VGLSGCPRIWVFVCFWRLDKAILVQDLMLASDVVADLRTVKMLLKGSNARRVPGRCLRNWTMVVRSIRALWPAFDLCQSYLTIAINSSFT